MPHAFPLFPQEASTIAPAVDHLFYFLTAVSIFFASLIFLLIFYFAVKYRRRSKDEPAPKNQVINNIPLEVTWTVIPMILVAIMYLWGAEIFVRNAQPPPNALEIFVIGKQWMWHIEHNNGKREINALHIPAGVPVKLTMTSQDVIHDFSVPAFRMKMDVVPDRYTTEWFEATQPGKYRLFCDQYCGMGHALMRGWVYVMTPQDYQRWLTSGVTGQTMAEQGAALYNQLGCVTCHGTGKGPPFAGLYGRTVKLSDGTTVVANDAYIRESILDPSAQIVNGYPAIMPTFKGQVSEEQILQLTAYIKSLASTKSNTGAP
ncbi:MAG TPA: cytochrome c oxidase subunit II [Terriglobia bacterium]|jgi:cytochrome c oxidase subunit 2|nr:cytochrome c oxidase subunit II [Terriglobia bacterium]